MNCFGGLAEGSLLDIPFARSKEHGSQLTFGGKRRPGVNGAPTRLPNIPAPTATPVAAHATYVVVAVVKSLLVSKGTSAHRSPMPSCQPHPEVTHHGQASFIFCCLLFTFPLLDYSRPHGLSE